MRATRTRNLESLAGQAEMLVSLTFVAIVGTVIFCALVAAPLARRLGLAHRKGSGVFFVGADRWLIDVAKALREEEQAVLLVDMNHENIKRARLAGLATHRGNALSDIVEEDLELTGIGNLLAVTPNDEVNSMAVHEFTHHFGSAHVFQLRPRRDEEGIERDKAPEHFRGRFAFGGEPTAEDMRDRAARGFVVKKTKLTEQFTIEEFIREHGEEAMVLFVIHLNESLEIFCDDGKHEWKPGQKIIALVPPPPMALATGE